jgi:hypothetical protein
VTAEMVFLDGAYRRHRDEDVERFTALAVELFPKFASRVRCFGADWLDRQFATDRGRIVNGSPQVLLLEPGSGEAFEIPVDAATFHETELLKYPNEVLEYLVFREWLEAGGARPAYDQCVSYKKPLFLGGEHEIANLAIGDLDVYWTICGQMLAQVRNLPSGTKIGSVKIS